jgi:hypothetical protein
MSRSKHEGNVVSLLQAIQAKVEDMRLVYTETFVFPAVAFGDGADQVWESDPTYRAKVLYVGINELSAAVANSPTWGVGSSAGNFAYVASLTVPTTSARTSADDSDASIDLERLMLPGATRFAPAGQDVTATGTDPGTATGTGTVYVVVGYFE